MSANELAEGEEGGVREFAGADEELREKLAQYTLEGNWDAVKKMYLEFPKTRTITINNSEDTALHVAVDLDEEDVVIDLVSTLVRHEQSALKKGNKHGDTPLHVAASRGFWRLCKCIIGEKEERIELRTLKNNKGETPLFLAALNGNKKAFAYLSQTYNGHQIVLPHLVRHNHDNILHCVIRREYFDLAVIIVYHFGILTTLRNKDGFTPLKVLATRPSAFPSGIKFSWWKRILYHCILVEPLNADRRMKKILGKMNAGESEEKFPKNYATLCDFIGTCWSKEDDAADIEKSSVKDHHHHSRFLPPNYGTTLQLISSTYVLVFGLHGVAVNEIRKTKKKHQWSGQVLDALMERPYEAFTGKGGERPDPRDWDIQPEVYNIITPRLEKQQATVIVSQIEKSTESKSTQMHEKSVPSPLMNTTSSKVMFSMSEVKRHNTADSAWIIVHDHVYDCTKFLKDHPGGPESILINAGSDCTKEFDAIHSNKAKELLQDFRIGQLITIVGIEEEETPFLQAARNGIVEMVVKIRSAIPSVIHNSNSRKENVVLVAVKHRQPHVVEALKRELKDEVWNNLIQAVDDDDNTVLHLAAQTLVGNKPWHVAGTALQMMWDIKWYQYLKSLVPQRCYFRSNRGSKTAWEIFETSHESLVENGSEWLKETSHACSVVAALVAGVSFATASQVPGGTNDKGKPELEGQPAFHAFAIASLIGLCFSVTGLIMFLSILTSRKEAKDFRRALPLKLLLGLSSLFVSIVAMFVSFCSGHFFIISRKYETFLFSFYAATSIPVAIYAVGQFPLYFDLLITIITKVPWASNKGNNF